MKALIARSVETLGLVGAAGIGLAVFCAAFYLGTIRPGEERLAKLRLESVRLERLQVERTRSGKGTESVEERLQEFYGLLASENEIGDLLDTIDATARRNGIVLRQGNYRFGWDPGSRAGRYEVTYTAQAPYYRARIFLHEVLHELPMLALDEIGFQRQQVTSGATDLTARFSLLVKRETFPAALEITAETAEGEIMGLRHREFPIYGVQFHPESILTVEGKKLLDNFRHL